MTKNVTEIVIAINAGAIKYMDDLHALTAEMDTEDLAQALAALLALRCGLHCCPECVVEAKKEFDAAFTRILQSLPPSHVCHQSTH